MAATLAGAVADLVTSANLGIAVSPDDQLPARTTFPAVTVTEGIAVNPEAAMPRADDPDGHVVELVQVDLYQQHRDPHTRAVVTSPTLADALGLWLARQPIVGAPSPIVATEVDGMTRVLDPNPNLTHHTWTLRVHRQLRRP